MAGKVAKYSPLSMSFGTGKGNGEYREDASSGSGNGKSGKQRSGNMMENLWPSFIDEDVIIKSLGTENEREKALRYLDRQFHENNSLLIFQNKVALFRGFASALSDKSVNVRIECTKLIAKILPQLGPDLEPCMNQVLPKIVANIGNCTALQKESIQTLHICMKHSDDVYQILKFIADKGIRHEDPKTRKQIIHSFPTLLFPEFKDEDFFDIVIALAHSLTDNDSDNIKVMKTMSQVRRFVGKDKFVSYVSDMPPNLQALYNDAALVAEASLPTSATPSLREQYSNGDLYHEEVGSSTSTPRDYGRIGSIASLQDFGKSTYFDSVTLKNSLGKGSRNRPNYLMSRSPDELQAVSPHYEFGFISRGIIEKLSSNDNKTRLEAVEDLKLTLSDLRDVTPLRQNIIPLISLLQPVIEDNNYRVSCGALQTLDVIVKKMNSDMRPYVKLVANAVGKRLIGKDVVRSECMKVLLNLEEVTDPGTVLDFFLPKMQHKQAKIREEAVNLTIASLLKFPKNTSTIKMNTLCELLAKLLIDAKPKVRQAALECVAVLANLYGAGSKNFQHMIGAVDRLELFNDDASGIMPAVQARLVRKQLPRLRENMLVEYAALSHGVIPISSPQEADINWVFSAVSKNANTSHSSMSQFSSSMNGSFNSSIEGSDPNDLSGSHQRRHLSAGKQRMFPWTRDESDPEKHPSSAPVQTQRNNLNETHPPPIRPRNTWGPESEKVPPSVAQFPQQQARVRTNRPEQAASNIGYLEIHRRRQENAIKESVTNVGSTGRQKRLGEESVGLHSAPISNMGRNMSSVAGTGGYQPSFAANDGSSRSHRPNLAALKSEALSNSCPTTFFDDNNQVKRFQKSPRRSPLTSVGNDSPKEKDNDDTTEPESPIRLKPQLARLSAKRRSNPNAASGAYENGTPRASEPMLTVQTPMKLKNSASPRLDRIADNPTVDKVRPIIKQSRNHNQLEQRLSKDYSDILDTSGPGPSLPGSGYTPSGLQNPNLASTQPLAVIRHPSHQMKSNAGTHTTKQHPAPSGFTFDDDVNDPNNNILQQHKGAASHASTSDPYAPDPLLDLSDLKTKPKADHGALEHEVLKGSKSLPPNSSNHSSGLITHPRLQQKASSPILSDTPRTAPHAAIREEDVPYKSSMDLIRHSAQKKRNQMQRSMSYGRENLDGSYSSNNSGPTSGRATAPESASNGTSVSPSSILSPISNKTNSHTPSPIQSTSRDSLDGIFINGFQSNQNRRSSRTDSEPSSTYSNDTGYLSTVVDARKSKKSGKLDADVNPFMTKPSIARPGSGRSNGSGSQGGSLAPSREPTTTEPPPFKYNPNSGVSFNTNKTKSNVSVVGFGYGPRSPLSSDTGVVLGSSPLGTPTNSSTSLTASPSSTSLSSKPSLTSLNPNQGSRERRRNQRGSSLGMVSTQMPGSVMEDDDFNIKGRAIRDHSSTNLSEAVDLSPTPSKEDIQSSSHSNESVNKHPPAGVYGKAVRQPSASSDASNEDNYGGRQSETVPLSASLLANQFKKKEDLEQYRKTRKGKMKQQEDTSANIQLSETFAGFSIENRSPTGQPPIAQSSTTKSKTLRKSRSPNSKVSPPRGASLDRKSTRTSSRDSSALRTTSDILPLSNPEGNLNDAISGLQTMSAEDWEGTCNHIHTFRRLAAFHQDVMASRIHEVLTVLCTNVRNLRSQVARAAVVCLGDIYTHMRKPAIDTDIEMTTKALLNEHGSKKGVFMQEEILKTFQYVVANVTSVKVLNAFLASGTGTRNSSVRDITAQFVSLLVEKMGPGKALSGVKDTTEKIIPAAASFITDPSHDTRYYGRRIVNELMTHHDFERCVDRYLNEKQAQEMKDAVQAIKIRGVGSIGSAGSHKNPGSGVRRNGSTKGPSRTGNSTAERLPQISSNSSKRRTTPSKSTFNDQDQEDLRAMCANLAQGDLIARKEAVRELTEKVVTNLPLVEDNVVKIMDSYLSLLTTSNAKLNMLGLENLLILIPPLNTSIPAQSLISPICRQLASKQHGEMALRVLNLAMDNMDPMTLLQQLATSAMYSPPGKIKHICIQKLAELIAVVSARKPLAVERHVLPVLWSLFSEKNAANLRKEASVLARALYDVMGDALIQYAESKHLSGRIKEMVGA